MDRIEKLRKEISLDVGDALITYTPHHLYYFTGFTGGEGYLIVTKYDAKLLVDGRYTTQAKEEVVDGIDVVLFTKIWDELSTLLSNTKRLWFEKKFVTVSFMEEMRQKLPNVSEYVAVDEFISRMRIKKERYELEVIKKAIDIAEKAFLRTIDSIRPGVRELDIAAELTYHMRIFGASRESFDIIVASGYRGALPHGVASEKVLQRGEVIIIDWGARYKQYVSDLTRVIVLGNVSDEVKFALNAVKKAQQLAIEQARCCMMSKDIDALARDYLKEKGLGDYFTHSLGHGIGIEIHESPRISYNSEEIIEDGVVFTVEPGVYFPGKFGIRIEDDVVMTRDGVKVLSSLDKVFVL